MQRPSSLSTRWRLKCLISEFEYWQKESRVVPVHFACVATKPTEVVWMRPDCTPRGANAAPLSSFRVFRSLSYAAVLPARPGCLPIQVHQADRRQKVTWAFPAHYVLWLAQRRRRRPGRWHRYLHAAATLMAEDVEPRNHHPQINLVYWGCES